MKPQNKRKGRRVLAAALTLSLTMGMFSGVHVLAEGPLSEAGPSLNQEFWTPSMEEPLPNTKGELSLEELAAAELSAVDIPAAVSAEEIVERGHVHRLREQEEDVYSIIFQNRDGTKTLYYFAEAVKYIDEDGTVRDKKNTLTELDGAAQIKAASLLCTADYRYVNALNDIRTYFPADLNADTGLVLEHDGVRIELTPEYARRSESEQASEEDAKKETEAPALSDALLSENADDGNAAETESALTQASSEPSDGDGAESSRTKESLSLLPEESLPSASAPSTENTGTEPPVSNTTAAAPTVPTVPAASIEPTGQTEPDETEASATAAVPSDSISSAVPAEPIMGEAFAKPAEPERVEALAARGEKKALAEDGRSTDAVDYPGVFGQGTVLRYTPSFSGVKEDILLAENPGVNEFTFVLETGGLSLIREEETILLIDPLTGERVAMLDNILVFDSAPPSAEKAGESAVQRHTYRVETIEPDARYRVTLVVDEEYLSAPSTVYPVVVDPSLSFISSGGGLQDATIYDKYSVNEGNSGSVFVGNYSARYGGTRGCARTLVKLPAGALYSIKASQVTSAKLYYRDLMCEADVTRIDCYTMNYDWNESTVTCSTQLWNGYGSLLSQADVGGANGTDGVGGPAGGYWYDFDITDAAKSWINTGKYYGVMLRANFESQASRTFASAQRSSYQPRLVVEYNADHVAVSQICLNTTSLTMTLNDTAYLTAKVLPSNATNRQVTWESSNPDVVSVGGSGMLCAKKAGSATITVRAKDNPHYVYQTCSVRVLGSYSYRDKEVLSHEDYAAMVALEAVYAKYGCEDNGNNGTCDELLRTMNAIRNKPEYQNKYSGYYNCSVPNKALRTTKVSVDKCTYITEQDIENFHDIQPTLAFLIGFIPGCGAVFSALYTLSYAAEQQDTVEVGNACFGIALDAAIAFLKSKIKHLETSYTLIQEALALNEWFTPSGKDSYVVDGHRVYAGDAYVQIGIRRELGSYVETYEVWLRNDVPIVTKKSGGPTGGAPFGSYEQGIRNEWIKDGYVTEREYRNG